MKKLLVTGASGFIGSNFCKLYSDTYKIYGLYSQHAIHYPGVEAVKADITNEEEVKALFKKLKPDAVLHLAALSDPNYCQQNPDLSLETHVIATEYLASESAQLRIPFVFASTDLVFDGKNAPYKETAVPNPISTYGTHKAIAEHAVHDIYPNAVVCRQPLMYGIGYGNGQSFLQSMLDKFRTGQQVYLFTDEYRTTISARNACEGLALCLEDAEGTIQLSSDNRVSRYEFGKVVADVFGFDKNLIVKSKRKDVQMRAPRPKDVSLVNEKAKALSWQPRELKNELESLKAELAF
jgi:dTDP-4-dehydrorhamnose reductase